MNRKELTELIKYIAKEVMKENVKEIAKVNKVLIENAVNANYNKLLTEIKKANQINLINKANSQPNSNIKKLEAKPMMTDNNPIKNIVPFSADALREQAYPDFNQMDNFEDMYDVHKQSPYPEISMNSNRVQSTQMDSDSYNELMNQSEVSDNYTSDNFNVPDFNQFAQAKMSNNTGVPTSTAQFAMKDYSKILNASKAITDRNHGIV